MEEQSGRQPRQRWQILFSRAAPALRLRTRDVLSAFETAFTAAGLPLSPTAGKRPKPRLALAAELPPGIEAEGEVIEVYFDEMLPQERVVAAGALLPDGLRIVEARDVWQGFPSAASQVRAAEYDVRVAAEGDGRLTDESVRGAIRALLGATRLPGRRRRGETERRADVGERDLRPLIDEVELVSVDEGGSTAELRMVLRAGPTGSARPEDVVAAMELPLSTARVARRRLRFVDTPPIAR